MSALLATKFLPLFNGPDGCPKPLPRSVTDFVVKARTGGRFGGLGADGEELLVSADIDMDGFIEAVGYERGRFALLPQDKDGVRFPQIGYVEVTADHLGLEDDTHTRGQEDGMIPASEVLGQVCMLATQMGSIVESTTLVMQQSLQTLASSMCEMQRVSVSMLDTANTTIQVANGVEALERAEPPSVDVQDLARKLDTTFKAAARDQGIAKWMPLIGAGMKALETFVKMFGSMPDQNPPGAPGPPQPPPPAPQPPPQQAAPPPASQPQPQPVPVTQPQPQPIEIDTDADELETEAEHEHSRTVEVRSGDDAITASPPEKQADDDGDVPPVNRSRPKPE